MTEPYLQLVGITKRYPGVQALSDVSLEVGEGEIVGLIGENGAGKSTLMNVLGGVVAPSSGAIRIGGVEKRALTVNEALAAGIAFVHQELNLFDNLDVASNVFIGREPLIGGPLHLISRRRLHEAVRPLLQRLGCDFGPETPLIELSLAQRQLVEIAKALSLDARVVILDEPTSSLTISETRRLLSVVGDLKAAGVAVVFISHRLNEIEECADRVVVLRDGRVAGHLDRSQIKHDTMIRLMIGRDLKALYTPPKTVAGEAVLELVDVGTKAHPATKVSLAVRAGEILGLSGLVGAGRTELARAVFGIDAIVGGKVNLSGVPVVVSAPRDAIGYGIFLVPEDRKQSGLLLDMSVSENVSLADLPAFASAGLINFAAEAENAEQQKRRLNIRVPSVSVQAGTLSGGNQQKVVLAKWLSMKPKAIIFDEPTRGVDVGSKAEIYSLMRGLADSGVAVLMISSDLEEVIGVSDRVAVMREGAISGFLERAQLSEEAIMRLATDSQSQQVH